MNTFKKLTKNEMKMIVGGDETVLQQPYGTENPGGFSCFDDQTCKIYSNNPHSCCNSNGWIPGSCHGCN